MDVGVAETFGKESGVMRDRARWKTLNSSKASAGIKKVNEVKNVIVLKAFAPA
jgi:hypothetical protein